MAKLKGKKQAKSHTQKETRVWQKMSDVQKKKRRNNGRIQHLFCTCYIKKYGRWMGGC